MITTFLCALLLVAAHGTNAQDLCPFELEDAILDVLNNCTICERAYWGIRVDMLLSNNTFETIFALDDEKYLLPASNNKILTTSVAFAELGPDFQIVTPVYVSSEGDICLEGRGDPSISYEILQQLGEMLSNSGVTEVRNVYVDNTYYDGPSLPENWEWSDLISAYGAQPSVLMVDENVIYFTVSPTTLNGGVTVDFQYEADAKMIDVVVIANTTASTVPANLQIYIEPDNPNQIIVSGNVPIGSAARAFAVGSLDPDTRFAYIWAETLTANQITISGAVSVQACNASGDSGWKEVGSLTSPYLSEMMNYTLLVSDNLYAETFLRHLGKTVSPSNSTIKSGLEKVFTVLTGNFSVDNDSFIQDDGCGISRQNLVSPQSIIEVIEHDYFMNNGSLYLSFFPVAGETGTLSGRFINTTAQGILHAKTGTLNGVNALSGYIDHEDADHPIIMFSIIANNAAGTSIPPLDEIGVLIASVRYC